jgi:hypothetical protein
VEWSPYQVKPKTILSVLDCGIEPLSGQTKDYLECVRLWNGAPVRSNQRPS